jgi:hypothetical protein
MFSFTFCPFGNNKGAKSVKEAQLKLAFARLDLTQVQLERLDGHKQTPVF